MKKYQKQLKNNLRFLGNVPVKIFNSYLDDYYAKENDLTPIKLKFESKKRNIDLIQKLKIFLYQIQLLLLIWIVICEA